MHCNRAGQTDTAQEFIALLTCAVSARFRAEPWQISLRAHELDGEDCDRFYLFLAVRRGQFYRFDGTKGESITQNRRDAGEKSRSSRTRLDFDLAWRASGAQLGRVLFPAAIALDQCFVRTSGS